jgi:hypothetical protein
MLDIETSAQIAIKIKRQFKECWKNAYKALAFLPESALYVEGFIGGVAPIEHGWCEVDGRIIDPTLFDSGFQPYQYFPGMRYTKQEASKALSKTHKRFPVAHSLPDFGHSNQDYHQAFEQAMQAS